MSCWQTSSYLSICVIKDNYAKAGLNLSLLTSFLYTSWLILTLWQVNQAVISLCSPSHEEREQSQRKVRREHLPLHQGLLLYLLYRWNQGSISFAALFKVTQLVRSGGLLVKMEFILLGWLIHYPNKERYRFEFFGQGRIYLTLECLQQFSPWGSAIHLVGMQKYLEASLVFQ